MPIFSSHGKVFSRDVCITVCKIAGIVPLLLVLVHILMLWREYPPMEIVLFLQREIPLDA